MTAWTDLVQKIFKDKSSKNSSYKLKHAMKDAAKVYKKHGKTAKKVRGGVKCKKADGTEYTNSSNTCENGDTVVTETEVPGPEVHGPVIHNNEVTETEVPGPEVHNNEDNQNSTLPQEGGKRKSKKAKKDKKRKSAKKSKK